MPDEVPFFHYELIVHKFPIGMIFTFYVGEPEKIVASEGEFELEEPIRAQKTMVCAIPSQNGEQSAKVSWRKFFSF